jgi:hypothetical protein
MPYAMAPMPSYSGLDEVTCPCCGKGFEPWLGNTYCSTCSALADDAETLGEAIRMFVRRCEVEALENEALRGAEVMASPATMAAFDNATRRVRNAVRRLAVLAMEARQ